jgi:hypothetical protein
MNGPLALVKVSLYRGARRIATSPERALAGKSEFAARDTSWKGIIDQHRKAINELEDQINILRDRAKSSQKEI